MNWSYLRSPCVGSKSSWSVLRRRSRMWVTRSLSKKWPSGSTYLNCSVTLSRRARSPSLSLCSSAPRLAPGLVNHSKRLGGSVAGHHELGTHAVTVDWPSFDIRLEQEPHIIEV